MKFIKYIYWKRLFTLKREKPTAEDDRLRSLTEQGVNLLLQLEGRKEDESIADLSEEELTAAAIVPLFLPDTDLSFLTAKVRKVRPDDSRAAFLDCAVSFLRRLHDHRPVLENSIEFILAPILGLDRDALIEAVQKGEREGVIRGPNGREEPGE